MAASGRSGSSSSSSFYSLSVPGSSPFAFSPAAAASTALTSASSAPSAPQTPVGTLDLGPPGYHATVKLFERHPRGEITVYLGPWEFVGSDPRRVIWQCSYEGEVLEHYLPTDNPSDLFPFTLHAQHRRFGDPRDMELYLTFDTPHRLRYVRPSGVVHDDFVDVQYEFTSVEGSAAFQSDLRRRDLVDWFDADVVWSDLTRRTDTYGNVRGMATIQRVKLWRDRHSTCHSLSFFANHPRTWREFALRDFEPGLRVLDRPRRRLQMNARRAAGRSRRFSASNIFRPRGASAARSESGSASASGSSTARSGPDERYLAIQFSPNTQVQPGSDDFTRFIERWRAAHLSDGEFDVPFPTNHVELPSPDVGEQAGHDWGLPPVLEPSAESGGDSDADQPCSQQG